jgi:DNA repair protein RAD16
MVESLHSKSHQEIWNGFRRGETVIFLAKIALLTPFRSMLILHRILQRLMLRRTKEEKADDLFLPPRIITIRKDEFDEEENDFYDALYSQSKTRFMGFVKEGTVLNNYAHVFDLLLRLRQAVDHPWLVLHAKEVEGDAKNMWCQLCHEPADDPILSKCKHIFCRSCAVSFVSSVTENDNDSENSKKSTGSSCPHCFKPLTIDLEQDTYVPPQSEENTTASTKKDQKKKLSILDKIDLENWRSSTKIEALLEELTKIRTKNPHSKSLVFSQFVNFLDLVEFRLRMAGIPCVKLDGRMNAVQKTKGKQMTLYGLITSSD